MQYTITHTCGHEETVQLYGPGKDRDNRKAWLAKQPCQDCKRSQQTAKASTQAVDLGLVDLIGSEKQVAWAMKIRQGFIDQFETRIPTQHKNDDDAPRARAAFLRVVNSHTEARFWIDNRNDSVRLFSSEYEAEFNK